jgi:hypothetical protein
VQVNPSTASVLERNIGCPQIALKRGNPRQLATEYKVLGLGVSRPEATQRGGKLRAEVVDGFLSVLGDGGGHPNEWLGIV